MAASAALGLLVVYLDLRALPPDVAAPRQLLRLVADLYLWTALLAILGWAHVKLNRPWRWLSWANESVYPWYVLHQTVIIVVIWWLVPFQLGPALEPALLMLLTVAGCWTITALVRRSVWLRPLFGLRRRARLPRPSPDFPACRSAHNA